MLRLRHAPSPVACALLLAASALAGCAAATEPAPQSRLAASTIDRPPPVPAKRLSHGDAEIVIARAIAEHEMRRP